MLLPKLKQKIVIIIGLVVLAVAMNLVFNLDKPYLLAQGKEELKGTITISGAWALYPMVMSWVDEFQKLYPKVRIDVAAGGAGKGMADALADAVDIGMVSREIYPAEIEKGAWYIPVVRDAVVATINAQNPFLKDLLAKGLTQKTFTNIWITGDIKDWGEAVGASLKSKHPIHVYTRSDACGAAQTWAQYLGKNQEDLLGLGVYGDPGLAEAVRKDSLAVGFNNINYAYQAKTKKQIDGICVLPIDINNNGRVDEDENFYQSQDDLVKGIASGKYPSPPARDLYFVAKGKPHHPLVINFLTWILTEGQNYVGAAGYINLPQERLQTELKKVKGK